MSANSGKILAVFMAVFLAAYAFLTFSKGGFFIGKHEGDTLHLLQMLFRMQDGDWPHFDFVTPIGILAFAPIVVFLKLGFGAGKAMLAGQYLVAVVLFPFIWWVARSRFSGGWTYLFAGHHPDLLRGAGVWRGDRRGIDLDALQPLGLGCGLLGHHRCHASVKRKPQRVHRRRGCGRRDDGRYGTDQGDLLRGVFPSRPDRPLGTRGWAHGALGRNQRSGGCRLGNAGRWDAHLLVGLSSGSSERRRFRGTSPTRT